MKFTTESLFEIKAKLKNAKNIMVVEDHTFYGGLYSIINDVFRKINLKINIQKVLLEKF